MSSPSTLLDDARALEAELIRVRRDLHRHPELGFRETRTAELVAGTLRELGWSVTTGVGLTGVVADLTWGEGPRVAIRADMDALPIQEESDAPYASVHPGVMHACGHDGHTSTLLGVARILAARAERGGLAPGGVRLLFQPSEEFQDEEGRSGAMRMVTDGAMRGVDAVVGLHLWAHLPRGVVYLREGPVMAGSDEIRVEVRGVSAHAAWPDQGVDALVLAAHGVVAAQQVVSRRVSPMESGVVTFGTIHGGAATNVLADRVTLSGTVRYFEEAVRERLHAGVQGAFHGLEAMGATVEVTIRPGYPPVVNHPGATAIVGDALSREIPHAVRESGRPTMAAEDFSILAREAPGVFLGLGAALPDAREHHHPRFDFDETVLPLAVASLAAAATSLLAP